MNGFYGFGFGHVFMMVIWLVIIGAIVWFLFSAMNQSNANETPLDIAKKRYAKGEITKEELEKIKRQL